jgi:chloride channel protein, CIC family
MPEPRIDATKRPDGVLILALLSLLAGAIAGLVCAVFRLLLRGAATLRGDLIAAAHGAGLLGLPLVVAGTALATAIAATLVRRVSPDAEGSGIPQVEAAIGGGNPGRSVLNAAVKFIGGLLAIGSGLALGREGPSVQMGLSIADVVARVFRRSKEDSRVLFAAGAGA